jgi:putative transcription factor
MLCEMCSSKDATLKVDIEGSRLSVCEKCSKYGRIISRIASPPPAADKKKGKAINEEEAPLQKKKTESIQIIKPDFAKTVKTAREKTGLTQEEFSKRINERESVIHNIESGHMKPNLDLARKLERALRISLVDTVEVEPGAQEGEKKRGPGGLTIGDLLSIK